MNICFITARINKQPKRILSNNKYSTYLNINFPHTQKGLCYATAVARGKIGEDIFELYCLNDYIIIEGILSIAKNSKTIKRLKVNIINVHPAHIFINK